MSGHRDDGTGRCELSDLLVAECAGCLGHSDTAVDMLLNEGRHSDGPRWRQPEPGVDNLPAVDAHPITAKYYGWCTAQQNCRIKAGDVIIATQAGGYMHAPNCPGGKQ